MVAYCGCLLWLSDSENNYRDRRRHCGTCYSVPPRAKISGCHYHGTRKESSVGRHQTGHNSGVLHAGIYYKPGSAKARLAVRGIRQMVEFCQQNAIPHEICGKLVVASNEEELPRMHDLFARGNANGLEGLGFLTATE